MRTGSWTARVALSIALVCAAMFAAWCQELPAADPAALGFSAERLARLGSSLESAVKAERIPGAVVLVARHGKVAYFETFGQQNHESGAPMRRDSIFRIYSMTKPIVSVAVMTLWEEGRFDLDDPIGKYLPEFSNMQVAGVQKDASGKPSVVLEPARRAPTIQQLLTHTGGLSYDTLPKGPDYPVRQMYVDAGIGNPEDSLAEMVAKIAGLPLAYQPGTVWEYSRSVDVLARLVEVVSGQPIDRFLASRIFVPLGMKDTGFWVPKDKLDRLAEGFANDRMIDVTKPPKLMSGNYGLVSTAEDYFRFEQMLINGGTFNGVRILGPRTVAYMTSDQIGAIRGPFYGPGPGYGFGLGFAVRLTEGQAPYAGTVGDYGWQGTAGTIFWVDPKEDLTAVLMVQRVGSFVHNSQLTRALVYQALN